MPRAPRSGIKALGPSFPDRLVRFWDSAARSWEGLVGVCRVHIVTLLCDGGERHLSGRFWNDTD